MCWCLPYAMQCQKYAYIGSLHSRTSSLDTCIGSISRRFTDIEARFSKAQYRGSIRPRYRAFENRGPISAKLEIEVRRKSVDRMKRKNVLHRKPLLYLACHRQVLFAPLLAQSHKTLTSPHLLRLPLPLDTKMCATTYQPPCGDSATKTESGESSLDPRCSMGAIN